MQAAAALKAVAEAANAAGKSLTKFRVACYPDVPAEDHPIIQQMKRIAEAEGKTLELVRYPRHIPERVFGQSYIVYDEISHLDWHKRHVVNWRGKKMVYRSEIHLFRS